MPLRPTLSLSLGLLPPLVLCLWLGQWQLDRMAEKQALFSQFENAERLDLSQAIAEGVRFAKVHLRGHYDPEIVLFLDNKIHEGRVGVHVLQLFHPDASMPILVNRGWLPLSPDRMSLPEVSTPPGTIAIDGLLTAPAEGGFRLGEPDRLGTLKEPQLITYLDLEAISEALDGRLSHSLILLDADDQSGYSGRDWQPSVMLPAQHGAYAAQWFGLAFAILITWLALGWRRGQRLRQSVNVGSRNRQGDEK